MVMEYPTMDRDFFGLVGELLNSDCGHRSGFSHIRSSLVKHNPDSAALARVHELACLTCENVWKFAQKSLPARV